MNKQEFEARLRAELSGLPKDEQDARMDFYIEMINDRIEDGLSEEEAVANIGSVDEIVTQILEDIPLAKLAKEKIKPKRRLRVWEIVLLALGSPIWISLLAAAFVVLLAVYIVIWSVIASLWAVFAAFAGCAVGGVASGVIFIVSQNIPVGIAMIGAGLVCAGLAVFMFFGCIASVKGAVWLTKKFGIGIKKLFIKKEDA